MAPAPRTSGRRRPSTSSSSASRRRTLLIAGGVVLAAVVVYVLYRRHSSSSSPTLDTSGTPGPDRTGSGSDLGPSGGSASVPGNLPPVLVSQPDQLQQQVQQTDTTSPESPQAIATAAPTSPPAPTSSSTAYSGPGGAALIDPSLPYLAPVPYLPSHPGVVGGAPQINIAPGVQGPRRPGLQLE